MIIGIGTDITDIRRIEKTIARFGDRFIKRCFTQVEQDHANIKNDLTIKTSSFAKCFAAKEACAKALGTGFREGVSFQDFELQRNADGAPSIKLYGEALKRISQHIQGQDKPKIHVSLSDEYPYAQAFVIIERTV